MAACQPVKLSPGGTQQLTLWMEFHSSMSASQIEPRRHTATHFLNGILWQHVSHSKQTQEAHSNWLPDGISWQHVSHSNGAQEAHSNSLSGWDFMAACQPVKLSPGGTQQLTSWMEFHSSMSASQIELRRHTATHCLDGISQQHVSHSNGVQEAHSNSQPGWNFMAAYQPFKMEPRRHTATHSLDGISCPHVSHSNGAQEAHRLTTWMGFHGSMSASQMEPRGYTEAHFLDIRWIVSVLSIWNSSCNLLITSCMLHSEFAFLSLWNSYLFPLIIHIITILSNELDVTPTYWIS